MSTAPDSVAAHVRAAVRRFLIVNIRASRAIEARLPQARENLQEQYEHVLEELMAGFHGPALVADVGGGRRCHFARHRPKGSKVTIVGVDISAAELADNPDVDERRVADITEGLPFVEGEVDVIAARSVLEHLRDTDAFVREAADALASGGTLVALFPGRHSPASLLNRALPDAVSQGLVHALVPASRGRLGFPAHYDRTSPSEMTALLERHGFEVLDVRVSYYQSSYFGFFVPLFVVSALYELLVYAIGARNLAATVLMVARTGQRA